MLHISGGITNMGDGMLGLIGRVAGNKDLYLGIFGTQEGAAETYDIAAIKFCGVNAVTNFDITRYDVEKIMASNTLLSGDLARRSVTRLLNLNIMSVSIALWHRTIWKPINPKTAMEMVRIGKWLCTELLCNNKKQLLLLLVFKHLTK